jgi:5-oxoprolinase (ATP-hydrolysing) subunit A
MMYRIDLNCDVGEGIGNEDQLMPYITSANIACGYHAGDIDTMHKVVQLCKKHNVAVGAHPSFPDRENFGRSNMNLSAEQVFDLVVQQILLLKSVAEEEGVILRHVKPHGALYNMAAVDKGLAQAIARATHAAGANLTLFGLSGGTMAEAARQQGVTFVHEVFADRTYRVDGTLTPRSEQNALIKETSQAMEQAVALATGKSIQSTDGKPLILKADSICLHGDGEYAVDFAKHIYKALVSKQITVGHGW